MAINNNKSPLDLFNQPNKYGSDGGFGNKYSSNSKYSKYNKYK